MKNQMPLLLVAVGAGLFMFMSSQKSKSTGTDTSSDALARIAEAKAEEARQKTAQGKLTLDGLKAQLDSKKGGSFLDNLGGVLVGAGDKFLTSYLDSNPFASVDPSVT